MKPFKSRCIYWLPVFLFWSPGCTINPGIAKARLEIREAEAAFAAKAEKDGLAAAFSEYAAPDAVINRGVLVKGPDAIKSFYQPIEKSGVKLKWKPDTVFVSEGGDLGYTYGAYERFVPDSTGTMIKSSGIFHTVWKKQTDGTWKYVWD